MSINNQQFQKVVHGCGHKWLALNEPNYLKYLDCIEYVYANDGYAFVRMTDESSAINLHEELVNRYRRYNQIEVKCRRYDIRLFEVSFELAP